MEQHRDRKPVQRPSRIALASCARCGRLHAVDDLLSFHPVCRPCAAR